MKHLLLTTIAAVVLEGCGPSVDIHEATRTGNIETVKQHIAAGTDVNTKNNNGQIPLDLEVDRKHCDRAEIIRKHQALALVPKLAYGGDQHLDFPIAVGGVTHLHKPSVNAHEPQSLES